jgi:RNA polymerase sigma-70 factor (ECF subfamily)
VYPGKDAIHRPPMLETSDDELMRAAGAGDRAAFSTLVTRHVQRMGSLAGRITGNRGDAEEIVQEAFLRAWLKAPSWLGREDRAGGAAFATWLGRVVVNLCLDRKRKAAPLPLEASAEVADPKPDAFAATAGSEVAARVGTAVAALPDRQRAAIALCHYEGLSNIEAAAMLDVTVGALESLLVRARKSLRTALADIAPEGSHP